MLEALHRLRSSSERTPPRRAPRIRPVALHLGTELGLAIGAYFTGGISAGYWLVRWRTGSDVRAQGSGGTGATNTARVLGAGGFALTFVLDVAKGSLAVAAGRWLEVDIAWLAVASLAVTAGHVWPMQLGFRGGKGVAPLIGAWLVLAPLALAPCLLFGALLLIISRRYLRSALIGLCLLAPATWWQTESTLATLIAAAATTLVLYTHRAHFRRETSDVLAQRGAPR